MAAPNVQISIQGGGAKLATLLPAIDGALEADQNGIVKITRVSGSSAGAIAAALIAAKADFTKLSRVLQEPELQALIGKLNKKLSAVVPERRKVRYWKLARLVWSITRGSSIEDINDLRNILEYLFRELCGFVPSTFDDLHRRTGIHLKVTSSDLLGQQGRPVENGPVITAILDSCALPFFYRNFRDLASNAVIDGGICDNLPVQYLKDKKNSFGEIFAICLTQGGKVEGSYPIPTNIFSYAWSIWSAVANDAVRRTKEMLNSAHIIDLESDVALTDFTGAFNMMREREKYQAIKDRVVTKFADYAKLQSFGDTSEKVTISGHLDAKEMMSALFGVYKQHFETTDYKIVRASYIVRADSLDKLTGGKSRRADQVTREVVLELPIDPGKSLACLRSFIDSDNRDSGAYTSTRWTVEFMHSKRKIKPIIIPADDPNDDLGNAIDCLLFFDEPLKGNDIDGYHIRISSHYAKPGAMLPLELKGSDFIAAENGHPMTVDRLDIVFCVPKQVGPIAVGRDPKYSNVEKGTATTDSAILDEYRYFQNADYNVYVYVAENVEPRQKIAARFTRIEGLG